MGGSVDGVGEIAGVRDVMHSEIKPYHEIFLLQAFTVKEFIEVNQGIVDAIGIRLALAC